MLRTTIGHIFSFVLMAFILLAINSPCIAASNDEFKSPARQLRCQTCHGELTLKYVHPPVKDDCLNCHMEHFDEGNERFNLQGNGNDGNELCSCCHFDPDEMGGHPVANHPTHGPRDPWDPKKPFTCLSCHTPHQSNMPKLFRYDYKQSALDDAVFPCVFCHRRAKTKYPLEENPVHEDLLIKNVDK